MENFKSRKFILSVLALISTSALCWFGRIDAGVYATVTVATVGAYLTANWAVKGKVATNG